MKKNVSTKSARSKQQNLLKTQRDFFSHLHDEKNLEITKLTSYSKVEALSRMNIYRNNVFGNFNSVLSAIYRVIEKILGEEEFAKLAKKYRGKYNSSSGNLDEYGQFFLQLFAKTNYLHDLAKLELAHYHNYFAADVKKEFNLEKFKKISPEKFSQLSFKLHPTCILLASKFSIHTIWLKEKKPRNLDKPEFVAVGKFGGGSVKNLSEAEFLFLSLIAKEKKLYEIYKKIVKKTGKEFDIGAMLNRFISEKVIVDFNSNG